MRRPSLALACVALAGCTASPPAEAPESRPPNIVLILADDLGYGDVGFHGVSDFQTPHLDALAASGVRFSNAYVTHPYCSPSRAGLLSGRYQHRFGHVHNPAFGAGEGLPLSETLLPEPLRDAGYTTGIVGKWHLGDAPEYHPLERGFDEFLGFVGGGHDYFASDDTDEVQYRIPLHRNRERIPVEGYLTDQFSAAAVDFVERHRDEPFFLYLAYNAPHTPMQAPPEYLERVAGIAEEKRRTYAAMATAVDDGVGRVREALENLGLSERTLVFFLSDNGGPPRANASSNAPLRSAKGTVYEGGVRVPFVVSWPGRLEAGGVYDEVVSSLDVFATTIAAAGAEAPWAEGVDLLPYLSGDRVGAPHERLFWHSDEGGQYAARQGGLKWVRALRREGELYDLAADIGEASNVATERSAEADALEAAVEAWAAEMPAPAWDGARQPERPLHPNTAAELGATEAEIDGWIAANER